MSRGTCKSLIIGNLTKDAKRAEIKSKDKDGNVKVDQVVKFAVAVNWGSGDNQVDYYEVTIRGKTADGLFQRLTRGAEVTVIANLSHQLKEDWQGQGLNCWLNAVCGSMDVTVHSKSAGGIGTSPSPEGTAPEGEEIPF